MQEEQKREEEERANNLIKDKLIGAVQPPDDSNKHESQGQTHNASLDLE